MEYIKVQGWNAAIHLPASYGTDVSRKYPTILFIPGLGEVGTDINKLVQNGVSAFVKQGWNVTIDSMEFIAISLQPVNSWPQPLSVKQRIDELKATYQIGDLHLTGLSMGGWTILNYANKYPDGIKTITSIEGVIPNDGYAAEQEQWYLYIRSYYEQVAKKGIKVVVFEQKNDIRGGKEVVNAMNHWKLGSGVYVLTNFGSGGHCCWNEFYGGQGKQPGKFAEINGGTMYDWIHQQEVAVLPEFITKASVRDGVLSWTCENVDKGDVFVIEGTDDFVKFEEITCIEGNKRTYKIVIK